jgi:hypothetical protein
MRVALAAAYGCMGLVVVVLALAVYGFMALIR